MNVGGGALALGLALHQLALGLFQSVGQSVGWMDWTCVRGEVAETDTQASFRSYFIIRQSPFYNGLSTTELTGEGGGKGGGYVVSQIADCCGTSENVWVRRKEESMKQYGPVLLPPLRVPSPSARRDVASAWSPAQAADGCAPAPPPLSLLFSFSQLLVVPLDCVLVKKKGTTHHDGKKSARRDT